MWDRIFIERCAPHKNCNVIQKKKRKKKPKEKKCNAIKHKKCDNWETQFYHLFLVVWLQIRIQPCRNLNTINYHDQSFKVCI